MSFAGKGNRKPQLDISIDLIEVDGNNPRLVPYLNDPDTASPLDIISVLYENFDTEVVAMSLIANGYFDEEPIIVIPRKLPTNFKFSLYNDADKLSSAIQNLINKKEIYFTVIEGNRRLSAIKLITDNELRKQLGIEKIYPRTEDQAIIDDISKIPCIIYEHREDISAYLGVRHIAGLLKWEAFAQAAYTYDTINSEIEKGLSIGDAIKHVQKIVGDRSDKLRKQYITFKLFLEARDNLNFDVRPIVNKFSLLTVAYNSASIREYLGIESYSKVNLDSELIDSGRYDRFRNILTWIYGNRATNEQPVLTDSRKITDTLSHVVHNSVALEYLLETKDLQAAFEMTDGEREYLINNLVRAHKAIQTSLKYAYKHKLDEDLLKKVEDLEELIGVLKKNLS